jgi:uncharacterized protein
MTGQEVIEAFYAALAKGDVSAAFSFFTADVKWNQPGSNKFSGIKNSPAEIGAMFGEMSEVTNGSLLIVPNGPLMVNGDLIACPVRFTGKKNDKSMDLTGIDLFEVKIGKITKVWLFSEDQRSEDDFWGK